MCTSVNRCKQSSKQMILITTTHIMFWSLKPLGGRSLRLMWPHAFCSGKVNVFQCVLDDGSSNAWCWEKWNLNTSGQPPLLHLIYMCKQQYCLGQPVHQRCILKTSTNKPHLLWHVPERLQWGTQYVILWFSLMNSFIIKAVRGVSLEYYVFVYICMIFLE